MLDCTWLYHTMQAGTPPLAAVTSKMTCVMRAFVAVGAKHVCLMSCLPSEVPPLEAAKDGPQKLILAALPDATGKTAPSCFYLAGHPSSAMWQPIERSALLLGRLSQKGRGHLWPSSYPWPGAPGSSTQSRAPLVGPLLKLLCVTWLQLCSRNLMLEGTSLRAGQPTLAAFAVCTTQWLGRLRADMHQFA